MEALLLRLQTVYNQLDSERLELLGEIYSPEIHFIDPFGEIRGLSRLREYFSRLYANVEECRFSFDTAQIRGQSAWLPWTMRFSHRRLNGGDLIAVEGVSNLAGSERLHYHRDYFDVGALLYRNLPVLGPALRWVDSRLHRDEANDAH